MHHRPFYWIATLILCTSGGASAQGVAVSTLHPEKQRELQNRGVETWTPGSGRQPGRPVTAPVGRRTITNGSPLPAQAAGGTSNTASMQYDDGVLSALPTVFGQVYGNRFAGGAGGAQLDTITLNSFSFYFMEDSLPDTGLFIQVSDPLNATQINSRASTNVSGLVNSGPNFSAPVLNVVPGSALGAGNANFNDTFFLGGWSLNSAVAFPVNNEVIGLSTNPNNGDQRGYTAISGTGPVNFSSQPFNAILRANITSSGAIPVELMKSDQD